MMLLLLLLPLLTLSEGLDEKRTLRLRHKLLGNYSRNVQPSSSDDDGDDRLSITLGFWPMAIVELDESKQVFTSVGSIVMRWLDPDLAWNESEISDIGELILLIDDVWLPEYTILNHGERISSRSLFSRVTVLNNGTVTYEITDVFKTICTVDLTRYPFDQQDCALRFSTLTAKYSFVEQGPFTLEITGYGFFTETKEWVLTELYSFTKTSYGISNVDFHFKVRRYPQFYVTTIIFPFALLSVLNSFVFLFPVESGENMSYLVSIICLTPSTST
ncbi:acetylcholine receptor subunit alpha-like [Gigantopelta aegis]|uniref:acetylcholine receptor subunit alpha-like n=1 Tax=Gigantopelta aegis TaxID=1735272 RepID=UPI001B88E0AD|nr:acetylcholine receptor subunit alpha-like [Gigantopelta aegis]